jgi:protein ImuB
MRIACLLVPDLPLHAELRASPELNGRPLVITSGPGTRAETIALSREAFVRGVRAGQTLPQARAVCPDIEVRVASPVLERAARETLLDIALSFAPRAELVERASGPFVSEGAVYVDAEGIEALHGSESAFASVLHARAERLGIRGFVAIASSRDLARLVARHLALSLHREHWERREDREAPEPEVTRILAPEDALAFLSPLPIDLLDPDDRTAQALTRFGLQTLRDLLRLPKRDLAARLGPALLDLIARVRGEGRETPLAEPLVRSLEEGLDLDAPIDNLEALSFVFRGLVSRLVERLSLRALGCTELRTTLRLENGARESRRIGVASPCQDERVLLRLLRLDIESRPPTAAIEGVTISSEGVPLAREQLDLFRPRGPSPRELDQTLAELGVICGLERVGTPGLVDDHRPGRFTLKPFGKDKPRSTGEAEWDRSVPRRPRLTLRALRPPSRAEVRVERGRPVSLQSAVSRGEVLTASGPWRTTGQWWSDSTHYAVDHYDIQMSDGTVLRLCFDWRTKWWQIEGLYD